MTCFDELRETSSGRKNGKKYSKGPGKSGQTINCRSGPALNFIFKYYPRVRNFLSKILLDHKILEFLPYFSKKKSGSIYVQLKR